MLLLGFGFFTFGVVVAVSILVAAILGRFKEESLIAVFFALMTISTGVGIWVSRKQIGKPRLFKPQSPAFSLYASVGSLILLMMTLLGYLVYVIVAGCPLWQILATLSFVVWGETTIVYTILYVRAAFASRHST